jgi:hypothetical protein
MGRPTLFAIVLVLGLLVSTSGFAQEGGYAPVTAPAPRATPVPPGYHIEHHVRFGPLVAGSIASALGYSLGALAASSGCRSDRWLFVPLAGPFVALATEPEHVTSGPCDDPEGLRHAVRAWSGIMQLIGGPLILLGANPTVDVVADRPRSHSRAGSGPTVAIMPALGPSTGSVVVLGTF